MIPTPTLYTSSSSFAVDAEEVVVEGVVGEAGVGVEGVFAHFIECFGV